jgi:hypothetical protein
MFVTVLARKKTKKNSVLQYKPQVIRACLMETILQFCSTRGIFKGVGVSGNARQMSETSDARAEKCYGHRQRTAHAWRSCLTEWRKCSASSVLLSETTKRLFG